MPTTQADMVNTAFTLDGGGSVQNQPIVNGARYSVRTVANGTIANTEATMDTVITNGIINIERVSVITVWFEYVEGSLTSSFLYPQFNGADTVNDTWLRMNSPSLNTAGTLIMNEDFILDFPASPGGNMSGMFSFPNPGAARMRFRIATVGTITSSSLVLDVSLGWGRPYPQSFAVL